MIRRIIPYLPVMSTFGVIFALRGFTFPFLLLFFFLLIFFLSRPFIFKKCILLLAATFAVYYGTATLYVNNQNSHYTEGTKQIIGTVDSVPNIDGDFFSMYIKDHNKELLYVRSFIKNEKELDYLKTVYPGDRCLITGTFQRPSPPSNFYQFDYRHYLQERGIHWILQPNDNMFTCYEQKGSLYTLQRWRKDQMYIIEKTVSPQLAGIMVALLFGERMMIDSELLHAYEHLSIVHLLAISGLHVGMVSGAIFYVSIRIGVTRERAMEAIIAFLPFYVIMTGAGPPVIRAACMTIVVLLCLRLQVHVSPLVGISLVYMMYLLFKPVVLFELGFQLSFLISFSLLVSAPLIQARYHKRLVQLIAITTLAQIFSLPLILYYTYEFSLLSIPLNIVYIPLITLIVLPLTFISFLFLLVLPYSFNFPLYLLETVVSYAHEAIMYLAKVKWTTIVTGKPNVFIIFLLYAVIVYGCVCWEKGKRNWWINPLFCFVLIISGKMVAPYADANAKVTMLDVGQGDSFLIELPYRQAVYVIDTGGTITYFDEPWRERRRPYDVGAAVVVPELKARGISRVHRLILSHGHVDHIGGTFALGEAIQIDELLYGLGRVETEIERELMDKLLRRGTKITFVQEGDYWEKGKATFTILSPVGTEEDLNARSVVLHANIEGLTFLFTGDLEKEGEQRLIRTYPHLTVDVLKAGHHGSRTSTTESFLHHIVPKAVFIPVGRNNRFNHPHEEVVERLTKNNIQVWRTDEDGAVTLIIQDGNVRIKQMSHEIKKVDVIR